ncbi:MAG: hypothetical protein ACI4TM_09015 [Candidatus Cryptobacteroides sp.]
MISFILWLVGAICCIWCIKDVFSKTSIDTVVKVLISLGLLCFSWIGLAVYYFILKDRIK